MDYQDGARLGSGSQGLALSVLGLTLPSVPFLYYSQELALENGVDGGVDPAARFMSVAFA